MRIYHSSFLDKNKEPCCSCCKVLLPSANPHEVPRYHCSLWEATVSYVAKKFPHSDAYSIPLSVL